MTGTGAVAPAMAVRERVVGERVVGDHGPGGQVRDLYWQGRTDHCDEAMALIDAGGQALRTTAAFDALLPGGDARWSTLPGERMRVDAAVARATAAVAPVAAAVRFRRGDGARMLLLVARPIPWATRLIHAPAGVATATLIDPAQRLSPVPRLWREAFDLTPSEAALAALLMEGHSVESAAAARDCSPATVRVHLRHVFAKTGVSRQSDLVALLARLGRG